MKNILLLVHDDEGQEARLEAALDIARAVEGHVTCLDVTPNPVLAGDIYVGPPAAALLVDERETEAANKALLTERLSREDVSWSWIDMMGEMANCVLASARLADIVIVSRALDAHPVPDMRTIAGRILAHSHTLVLAVPPSQQRFEFDRALVAWDGGPQAAATLRAAVPFLALAKEVEIFSVRDDDGTDPGEAAAYLSRHDVHAAVRTVDRAGRSAGKLIAEEAERLRADYVVMGAYGRGRLMEVFGGVTKRMLTESPVPILLSH